MRKLLLCLLFAASLPGQPTTPAGKAIEAARAAIMKEPQKPEHHRDLAMAYSKRARETSDPAYYDKGLAEVTKALEFSPDNIEVLKVKGWLLLGKHEFADALKLATELRRRSADDEMIYGLLTDANVELGNYADAEDAAQWMLNVGRSSIPGLTRAAFLRELFGDIEGALELMTQAYQRLNPAETEDRAWTLTQIAHLLTVTGKLEEADRALADALRLAPEYHYALAGLAKVRTGQGKLDEAVQLLRRRYELAPHPENAFDVAVALERAGKGAEAKAIFQEFEKKAAAESKSWDNANRELIFYYTDYAARPAAALALAEMEIRRRKDVFTLEAYAWALHRSGRDSEGLKQIETALAVGTVDPRILYHAGAIALAAGKHEVAARYLQKSIDVNARSEVARNVRRTLSQMQAGAKRNAKTAF